MTESECRTFVLKTARLSRFSVLQSLENLLKILKADDRNRLPFVISFINIYALNITDFPPRLSKVTFLRITKHNQKSFRQFSKKALKHCR